MSKYNSIENDCRKKINPVHTLQKIILTFIFFFEGMTDFPWGQNFIAFFFLKYFGQNNCY